MPSLVIRVIGDILARHKGQHKLCWNSDTHNEPSDIRRDYCKT